MKRLLVVLSLLAAAGAGAEEWNLFQASTAGADVWSWGGARIKPVDDGLLILENNGDGDYGDVYLSGRLPRLPGGVIKWHVGRINAGTYTLQLIAFHGQTEAGVLELAKDSAGTEQKMAMLDQLPLPPEADSLAFKVWVTGAEGASSVLSELLYSINYDSDAALYETGFNQTDGWQAQDGLLPVRVEGGRLHVELAGEAVAGCAVLEQRFPCDRAGSLLLEAAVAGGAIALQLEVFDEQGHFIAPVDIVKDAGAGQHGADLAKIAWPANAATFGLKLWLSGGKGATAEFDRLAVTGR